MAECYRHDINNEYYAVVFLEHKTGKIRITRNIGTVESITDYWNNNEVPNFSILELKPIKNVSALLYFDYWNKLPKRAITKEQKQKKFDFYKYVLGADLSDKYRGVSTLQEVKDNKEYPNIITYSK